MTERPSGWYDDPQDESKLRYWDGILWSDRTMPKLRPGLEHVGQARPAPPRPPQPVQRRDGEPRTYPAHWGPEDSRNQGGQPPWGTHPQARPHSTGLASIGRRIGATVLDWLLFGFVGSLVAQPFLGKTMSTLESFNQQQMDALRDGAPQPQLSSDVLLPVLAILGFVTLALIVYEAVLTARGGRTLGKMAFGLQAATAPGASGAAARPGAAPAGERVPFGRALARAVVKWLPALLGAVGMAFAALVLLPALGSPLKQGLHDRLARTVVQRR